MGQKPELVMLETPGFHNSDLETARARLIKDGSWKNQRVIMIIPAGDQIYTKVVLSLMSLAFPPNNGVVRIAAQGMEVGIAYSSAIEGILADPNLSQWEYILTVEHDNIAPPDAVIKLIRQMEAHPEYACIGGLYFTKGYEGVPQIWGDPKDPVLNFRPQLPDPNGGLVECCGTGMGFNLFRLNMFKDSKLRRPWFKTQTEQGVSTQDLYFWSDARKFGYRCAIDCSIKIGHYDGPGNYSPTPDFVW